VTRVPQLRISLRPDACTGHARCNAIAPALFPLDDEGYSALRMTTVPPDQETDARKGVDACPERAIVLEK
jgi:ferredoxin